MMKQIKKVLCVVITLLISGCAVDKNQYTYRKVFESGVGYEQAKAQCEYESTLQSRADNRADKNESLKWALLGIHDPTETACMKRFGWSLEKFELATQQVNAATQQQNLTQVQQQNNTQAQQQSAVEAQQKKEAQARINAEAKAAFDEINKIVSDNCSAPEYKEYYAKTACLAPDITFEQLADETKITKAQKSILPKQRQEITKNRKKMYELYVKYYGELGQRRVELSKTYLEPKEETNNLDLFNGKITWGQYNKARKDMSLDFSNKIKDLR